MPRSKLLGESSRGKRKDRSSDVSITRPQLPPSQKSLSESFRSSISKESFSNVVPSPSTKRAKLDHSPESHPTSTIAPANMYDFSKPNHIDLTNGNAPAMMTTVQKKPVGMVRSSDTGPDTGPKKLVVKNLRKAPRSDPERYFNDVWAKLDSAISAILANDQIPSSNEELYRGAENLCRQGRAAPLFKTLWEKCRQGITNQFQRPLISQVSNLDDVGTLRAVISAWDAWNIRLVRVRYPTAHTMYFTDVTREPSDRYSFSSIDPISFTRRHYLLLKRWARPNSEKRFSRTVPSSREY